MNAIVGEKDVLKNVLANHVRISIITFCQLKLSRNKIKNLKIKGAIVERVLAEKTTAFVISRVNNAPQAVDAAIAKIMKQLKKKTR